ncbi:MAG: DUF3486 family protein [Thalassobaculaceae bacterium]
MPRPSTISTLPDDVLDQVNKLLRDQVPLEAIVERLKDLGYERSKSALDRFNQRKKAIGKRLRQSREMANALAENLGDAAVQGKQGRMLVEMARTLTFDLMVKIDQMQDRADRQADEEDAGVGTPLIDTKDVQQLGKGLAELARALRYDQDFETKLRDTIREEERQKAAAEVAGVARKGGISDAALAEIRQKLGIEPGNG